MAHSCWSFSQKKEKMKRYLNDKNSFMKNGPLKYQFNFTAKKCKKLTISIWCWDSKLLNSQT